MKKGIVMEVNRQFLTVLTPEGEFLRAQNQNHAYKIGQEINFIPYILEKRKNPFDLLLKRKMAFSAAVAILLFSIFFFPYYQSNQVYAYMSIDINPSLELAVNQDFEVLDIIPYNNDGKKIINKLGEWNKKDLNVVTSDILREIKDQGYMDKDNDVVISTIQVKGNSEAENKQWGKEIASIKKVIQEENIELTVIEGTKEERDKAKEKGITTGILKEKQIKAEKEKKSKNTTVPKTEPSTPMETPIVEPSNEDKLKEPKNNQSEVIPGQQKKEEPNQTNPGNSAEAKNKNDNFIDKKETDTVQSQNIKKNENSIKQNDKNVNANNIDKDKENQGKQDKNNK